MVEIAKSLRFPSIVGSSRIKVEAIYKIAQTYLYESICLKVTMGGGRNKAKVILKPVCGWKI